MSAPFQWLYDGLPEDGIQEYASLRGDLASDGAEAAQVLYALVEREAGGLSGSHFAVGYLRPLAAIVTIYDDDCNEVETLRGAVAEEHATKQDRLDELFYEPCEPDDEGAADWWHCDLVMVPA